MYWRLVGSTLVAIHDAWALASPRRRRSWWYTFASPRRHHPFVDVVRCCPSRTAVRRAFVSVKLFGVAALRLELGDVEGAGRRTIMRGRRRWCRLAGCVRPFGVVCGFHGPWSSFGVAVCFTRLCCRCCVVVVFCWAVVVVVGWLGSCHPAGFMWRYMGSTWWRSGRGLSLGGVSRLWETSLAWWLLVEEETSQGCDFGITFNTHVKSTNLFGRISNKCYWKLVIQT